MNNPMGNVMNMIRAVKTAQNPTAMIQNMAAQNPQVQQAIRMAGGDPKAAFYNLARQRGVNPDDVLNMLRK
jgi:hypothetical protein